MSTLACTSVHKCTLTQTHITIYKSPNSNSVWEVEGSEFGTGYIGGESVGFYVLLEYDRNREMTNLVSDACRKQNDVQKIFSCMQRYHQSLVSTDFKNTGTSIFQSWQKQPGSSTEPCESVQQKSVFTPCSLLSLDSSLQSGGICC